MEKPQTKPPATAPQSPGREVAANTDQRASDSAPPAVPSAPSPDTRGSIGTSTAEGPSHPQVPVPDTKAAPTRRDGDGRQEVSPPGERVDDEATDGKVTRRQE